MLCVSRIAPTDFAKPSLTLCSVVPSTRPCPMRSTSNRHATLFGLRLTRPPVAMRGSAYSSASCTADQNLLSFIGPMWRRSREGTGAGATAAALYSTPSSPCPCQHRHTAAGGGVRHPHRFAICNGAARGVLCGTPRGVTSCQLPLAVDQTVETRHQGGLPL